MERKGGDDVKLDLEEGKDHQQSYSGHRKRCSRGWITGCRFQKRYFGVKTRNDGSVQVLLRAFAVQYLT